MSSNPSATIQERHRGTVEIAREPSVYTIVVPRTMTLYPISKRELQHVSAVNTVVMVCISVATLFVGLLLGCIWDVVQQDGAVTRGQASFIAACVLFGGASASLGGFFIWHKASELSDILSEADAATQS